MVEVDVPVRHPVFTKGAIAKVVQLMGLTIRMCKLPSLATDEPFMDTATWLENAKASIMS